MQKLTTILIITFIVLSFQLNAQDSDKFSGESQLKECIVDLPLTYMTKEKVQYTESARALKDKELIFMTFDKKKKTATYQRLYVNVMPGKDGDIVYLETSEDHAKTSGNKQALFTRYYPDKNRYYLAECFDETMLKNPELGANIKLQ